MKPLKTYKKYNSDDWKIGDIVVPIKHRYDFKGMWLIKDEKYKIVDIEYYDVTKFIEDRIKVEALNGKKLSSYFDKSLFITEAEYDAKNYNI